MKHDKKIDVFFLPEREWADYYNHLMSIAGSLTALLGLHS